MGSSSTCRNQRHLITSKGREFQREKLPLMRI